jgi:hypothetical protein
MNILVLSKFQESEDWLTKNESSMFTLFIEINKGQYTNAGVKGMN